MEQKPKFYYLHVWACGEFDKKTKIDNRSISPVFNEETCLILNRRHDDDLFRCWPIFVLTERLRSLMVAKGFEKLHFKKIPRVIERQKLLAQYQNLEFSPFYWWLSSNGIPAVDDFGIWNKWYPVVSEKMLNFLRDNYVTHAESDLIEEDLNSYFYSDRKNFWKKTYFPKRENH